MGMLTLCSFLTSALLQKLDTKKIYIFTYIYIHLWAVNTLSLAKSFIFKNNFVVFLFFIDFFLLVYLINLYFCSCHLILFFLFNFFLISILHFLIILLLYIYIYIFFTFKKKSTLYFTFKKKNTFFSLYSLYF